MISLFGLFSLPLFLTSTSAVSIALALAVGAAAYTALAAVGPLDKVTSRVPVWTLLPVPPISAAIGLYALHNLHFFSYLFTLGLSFVFFHFWFVTPLSVYSHLTDDFDPQPPYPSISVVIPAYNEAGYITDTIESVVRADYPERKKQVIVVDDGSTDATFREAAAYAEDRDEVLVLSKENEGKYSALNLGFEYATGEYIVNIDADSQIRPNALKEIVTPFEHDERIGAVAGYAIVQNRNKLLTAIQSLEYTCGMSIDRKMYHLFGSVPVIPGCLGAFRRDALAAVGNYSSDTITEDFDVTLELLKTGYEVRTNVDAKVSTEAPDTFRDLYKQRLRWYRGYFMNVRKHGDILRHPEYGMVHTLAYPYTLLRALISPVIISLLPLTLLIAYLSGWLANSLSLLIVFMAGQAITGALGLVLADDDVRFAALTPFLTIGYLHFDTAILVKSFVDVFTESDIEWTSPTRTKHRDSEREDERESPELLSESE